jgi:hypothetical protein
LKEAKHGQNKESRKKRAEDYEKQKAEKEKK